MLPDFVLAVFDKDNNKVEYTGKEAKEKLSTGHYLCLKMNGDQRFVTGCVRAILAEELSRYGIQPNGDRGKVLIQKVPMTLEGFGTEVWIRVQTKHLTEIQQFERSRIRR